MPSRRRSAKRCCERQARGQVFAPPGLVRFTSVKGWGPPPTSCRRRGPAPAVTSKDLVLSPPLIKRPALCFFAPPPHGLAPSTSFAALDGRSCHETNQGDHRAAPPGAPA